MSQLPIVGGGAERKGNSRISTVAEVGSKNRRRETSRRLVNARSQVRARREMRKQCSVTMGRLVLSRLDCGSSTAKAHTSKLLGCLHT